MANSTDPSTINEILKQLKQKLGVAFTSPSGSRVVNIFELENLLSTLINLHERYAACSGEQDADVSSDNRCGQATVNEALEEPKQKEEEEVPSENLATTVFDDDPELAASILSAKSTSSHAVGGDIASDQEGDGFQDGIAEGHAMISVETASSAINSNSSLLPTNTEGELQSRLSEQSSVGSIIDSHCIAAFSSESKSGSSSSSYNPSACAKDTEPSVPVVSDCMAMLEGCKNHLELLREEIASLNTRCQAQHEQSLQFASSLDGMVERFADHDPKLNKLETDTHCLGMLISDYEVEFEKITKHFERQDGKLREIDWTFQRMDRERDVAKAEQRNFTEQLSDLATAKADREYVEMELNLRALITDMERRVPFDQHNATIREMSRTLTQLQEQFNDVDENLKTVQYQLVKGLGDKASTIDLNDIRRQLAGLSSRWHKMEKSLLPTEGQFPPCSGDSIAAGVSVTGISVPKPKMKFLPTVNPRCPMVRGAGGPHTKSTAQEKVFRAVSECAVKPVAHKDHNDAAIN